MAKSQGGNGGENGDSYGDHTIEPREVDVLCGRGGMSNHHPGNEWYRRLIRSNRPLYRACPKHTKLLVSKAIVQAVEQQGGRFLERNRTTGFWYPVPYKRAVDKTSQGLRERDREAEDPNSRADETPTVVPHSFSGKTANPKLSDLADVAIAHAGGLHQKTGGAPSSFAAQSQQQQQQRQSSLSKRNNMPPMELDRMAPEPKRMRMQQPASDDADEEDLAPLPPTLQTRQSSMFRLLKHSALLPASSGTADAWSSDNNSPSPTAAAVGAPQPAGLSFPTKLNHLQQQQQQFQQQQQMQQQFQQQQQQMQQQLQQHQQMQQQLQQQQQYQLQQRQMQQQQQQQFLQQQQLKIQQQRQQQQQRQMQQQQQQQQPMNRNGNLGESSSETESQQQSQFMPQPSVPLSATMHQALASSPSGMLGNSMSPVGAGPSPGFAMQQAAYAPGASSLSPTPAELTQGSGTGGGEAPPALTRLTTQVSDWLNAFWPLPGGKPPAADTKGGGRSPAAPEMASVGASAADGQTSNRSGGPPTRQEALRFAQVTNSMIPPPQAGEGRMNMKPPIAITTVPPPMPSKPPQITTIPPPRRASVEQQQQQQRNRFQTQMLSRSSFSNSSQQHQFMQQPSMSQTLQMQQQMQQSQQPPYLPPSEIPVPNEVSEEDDSEGQNGQLDVASKPTSLEHQISETLVSLARTPSNLFTGPSNMFRGISSLLRRETTGPVDKTAVEDNMGLPPPPQPPHASNTRGSSLADPFGLEAGPPPALQSGVYSDGTNTAAKGILRMEDLVQRRSQARLDDDDDEEDDEEVAKHREFMG